MNRSINQKVYSDIKQKFNSMNEDERNSFENSISWFILSDTNKRKMREKLQSKMKNVDKISLLLACIGCICSVISSYLYIDFEKVINTENNKISIIIKTFPTSIVQILRGITSLSTVILIICIIIHYRYKLVFLKLKQEREINSTLFNSGLIWYLITEILIISIHVPPYTDNFNISISTTESKNNFDIDIDLLISCLVPLRIYLFFKYFTIYSSWGDDRAVIICNECNASGGIKFAIKAELKERPFTTVGTLMVVSIIIFGYILRNVEAAFMREISPSKFQDWRYIWNGFWCIIITILTVGYGDYYPRTYMGRAIAVVACIWGTFLISLIVISITISVEFSNQEEKAYNEIKNELKYSDLKKKALIYIKKVHYLKKICVLEGGVDDNPEIKRKYKKALNEYEKALKDFRKIRKDILNKEYETSNESILHQLNVILYNDMNDLLDLSNHYIINLNEQIKLSKSFQNDIDNLLNKLEKMTKGLYKCINSN